MGIENSEEQMEWFAEQRGAQGAPPKKRKIETTHQMNEKEVDGVGEQEAPQVRVL